MAGLFGRLLEYHGRMLADRPRVDAFSRALAAAVTPQSVVLDLGAGTGVLSMLACRAGAKRVYAIERTDIAGLVPELAAQNGYADRIVLLRGVSDQFVLPEPVDVIVTETVGNIGLDEGILAFVLDARRRMLRPDASPWAIIPRHLHLWAAPLCNEALWHGHVGRWGSDVNAIDTLPLRARSSETIFWVELDAASLAAAPQQLASVDLRTVEEHYVAGTAELRVARDSVIHGVGLWFEAQLGPDVWLCNAPAGTTTRTIAKHWLQGFLPLREPLTVAAGETMTIELQTYDGHGWRWRGTTSTGQAFDQCSLFGCLDRSRLNQENLGQRDAMPQRSARLDAVGAALGGLDGNTTLDQLGARMLQHQPNAFPTRAAAIDVLRRLLEITEGR